MCPVAKWFIIRAAASAYSHSISNLIGFSVSRNHRDTSAHSNWAADLFVGVLDKSERWFKFRFDGLACSSIPHHQPSGGTMSSFIFRQSPGLGIVRLFDQIPYSAFRITKTGERAQVLLISEHHRRPFNPLGLPQVRLMAGRFGAVERNLCVRAIAKRFVGRLAAAAKRILLLRRVFLSFPVIERFALGVGDNRLLAQWQVSAHEIGPSLVTSILASDFLCFMVGSAGFVFTAFLRRAFSSRPQH